MNNEPAPKQIEQLTLKSSVMLINEISQPKNVI